MPLGLGRGQAGLVPHPGPGRVEGTPPLPPSVERAPHSPHRWGVLGSGAWPHQRCHQGPIKPPRVPFFITLSLSHFALLSWRAEARLDRALRPFQSITPCP